MVGILSFMMGSLILLWGFVMLAQQSPEYVLTALAIWGICVGSKILFSLKGE